MISCTGKLKDEMEDYEDLLSEYEDAMNQESLNSNWR